MFQGLLRLLILIFIQKRLIVQRLQGFHHPVLTVPGRYFVLHGLVLQRLLDLVERVLVVNVGDINLFLETGRSSGVSLSNVQLKLSLVPVGLVDKMCGLVLLYHSQINSPVGH
ncbi:hypothetical protein GSI_09442 [Ganoderma sinense ZZ0214-1]|uniref:Secreted protein n=1 Tax=Ganoderma sinense ZZ0214-1 TaxID=1077348 RepID=A0A2G8S6I6_9APHY|nr:hypothetical protein GSI_09442 [Ganoderma sinense ZZ0214-1]